VVNLPADLPDSFGARFNAARFASQSEEAEAYAGIVLDPQTDPSYIGTILANTTANRSSARNGLPSVPLGWEPRRSCRLPSRAGVILTGGRADRPSALYLQQHGVAGAFGIFARDPGAWGNQISITVRFRRSRDLRPDGFPCGRALRMRPGDRTHRPRAQARRVSVTRLTAEVIKPGPVGAVQAKAAGIHATVTRERA